MLNFSFKRLYAGIAEVYRKKTTTNNDSNSTSVAQNFSMKKGMYAVGSVLTIMVVSNYIYKRCMDNKNDHNNCKSKYGRYKRAPGVSSRSIPYFGSFFSYIYFGEDYFTSKIISKYIGMTEYKIGKCKFVTLNDINLCKKVLNDDLLMLRPKEFEDLLNGYEKYHVTSTFVAHNEMIHERRKMLVSCIEQIQTSKNVDDVCNYELENILYPVLDKLVIEKKEWNYRNDLRNCSFNLLFGILFGKKRMLSRFNKDFLTFSECLHYWVTKLTYPMLPRLFYIPRIFNIRLMICNLLSYKFRKTFFRLYTLFYHNYMLPAIDEYNTNKRKNGGEFISGDDGDDGDATLLTQLFDQISEASTNVTKELVCSDILALMSSATEVMSVHTEIALLWLVMYPKLQEKLADELTSNGYCGNSTKMAFKMSQYLECKLFKAFICEVLRLAVIAPKGIPRAISETCVIKYDLTDKKECCNILFYPLNKENEETKNMKREFEYIVEKSSIVEPNLLYILRENKDIWGKHSSQFDATRYFEQDEKNNDSNYQDKMSDDDDDKTLQQKLQSLVFGFGKRQCVGYLIGLRQLRIIMAHLILNYKFSSNVELDQVKFAYGHTRYVMFCQLLY